jgi:PAS domain S-box-containing protein
VPDLRAFLDGGGEMAELIRSFDWATTPLGPIHDWPQSLRSVLSISLRSKTAAAVFWGPDYRFIYNDAWASYLGDRHPRVLGKPAWEALPDIWPAVRAHVDAVFETAEAVTMVDALLMRDRPEGWVESYWTYSLLPVGSEDGSVGGLLAQARETTDSVLKARQDAFLLGLAEELRGVHAPADVLATALALTGEHIAADRVGFGEIHLEEESLTIEGCWTNGTLPDISGIYPIDHFNPLGLAALRQGQAIMVPNVEETDFGAETKGYWAAIGSCASLVVPLISQGRYTAIFFAHSGSPRHWLPHEESLLRAVLERLWQDFRHARAEAALRFSEQRYRQIFEGANDLIFSADLDQRIVDANPAAAAALGLSVDQVVGRSISEFVSPEGFERTSTMLQHKLRHEGSTRYDIEVISATGEHLFWEINSTLAKDRDGKVIGLSAIGRDVTERRRYEDRQRLLVHELNHRVKNMLALVQGLALQSFKEGRDASQALDAFQQRLGALAAAHDLLTRESWEGATLAELVRDATAHHSPERIHPGGPDIKLNPRSAVSLVMALHELCTNAAKYGALSVASGEVSIEWTIEGDEELVLNWVEINGPAVPEAPRQGFGFRMIQRALAADLGGEVQLNLERSGLRCMIAAPLSRVSAQDQT